MTRFRRFLRWLKSPLYWIYLGIILIIFLLVEVFKVGGG